jgi:putative spermidine/putrescine transport system substrate-binding protein
MGGPAHAATALTVVEWGTPYVEAMKQIAAKQQAADITWVLHQGGSATILPKIKASWPNKSFDLVAAWRPVFLSMMREGWLEPVARDKVPNLNDVPEGLITKDEKGTWYDIPRSVSGAFFAYRSDICPVKITKIQDLLDPKLKGQISWPAPIFNTNLQLVALALANGGDERNIEPGWVFLKELAKSGNIGRIHSNMADFTNSFNSGETSVTFADSPTLAESAKNVPVEFLTKTDPSLRTFPWAESWGVLKNSQNKDVAFEFANFTLEPENCTFFNQAIPAAPANAKAKPVQGLEFLSFTPDEIKKFAYFVDFDHVSKELDGWIKRFESEIAPLL